MRGEWIGFFDSQYHRVIRFVMNNGATLHEAQDAAQEAFIESWCMAQTRPAEWAAITGKEAWIRTVALRKYRRPPGARTRLRADPAAEMPEIPAVGASPEELAVQSQMVLRALRSLDEEARAVMAFHLDEFITREIAATLGVNEQRVRDILKRARKDLKRHLARSAEGSEQR